MLSFKPALWFSSFTFIKRIFSSSLLSARRVKWSAYLRLLIFLLAILVLACASSSLAFLTMYSACKLNNQGDNIQPWHTPFLTWNQSVIPCPVLTCFLTCIQISQEAGQVVWYSLLFRIFPYCLNWHIVYTAGENHIHEHSNVTVKSWSPTSNGNLVYWIFCDGSLMKPWSNSSQELF